MSAPAPRLDVRDLSRSFGGIAAVRNVSFTIPRGQLVGLVGPNGAGKTTLFNLLAGTLAPDRGTVLFDGETLTGKGVGAIARGGLGRCFQAATVFPGVSVREQLTRAAYLRHVGRPRDLFGRGRLAEAWRAAEARTEDLLSFLDLGALAERAADTLAYGQQKILGLGMALATDPRMVLADEPAAGLNPVETRGMEELLRRVRAERGVDILLVEHDLRMVMALCDRLIVLNAGEVIADDVPSVVRHDPAFVAAYLGEVDAA